MASDVDLSRRFQLIVFDWDGTLVDSTGLIARSLQEACRDIGAAVPDESSARHVIGLGLGDALRYAAPAVPEARYPELAGHYRNHYVAREKEISLFDGVREMLDELDAAGFLLAVATGKGRAGLERALALQGLTRRFFATRCADEGRPKPHPDMLLHLMDCAGADPDTSLMIGDTSHDLELARNAGAAAVAVSWGAHPAGSLADFGALATVDSIAELRQWLRVNARAVAG
ncbi:MAG: HAD-IA family hydrolase [Casimicrobiaceae bacterium]